MPLPDTYTRRQRALSADRHDVYSYDEIPSRVKVQTVQLIEAGLGPYGNEWSGYGPGKAVYDYLVQQLRREEGVHELIPEGRQMYAGQELLGWLEHTKVLGSWLDGVEMSLRSIDKYVASRWNYFEGKATEKPADVLEEFNNRCREAGVGYQYVDGNIIRIDSQLVHQEVVLPALKLLSNPLFEAANNEYREAHAAFRRGNLKDCLVGCTLAFESVLKVIAGKRGWPIQQTDTANKLVEAAVTSGFLATYHKASLHHLQGLLTSSIPTVRNKNGGHGDGAVPKEVPTELAAYQLHQTAAVILYLAQLDAALP